MATNKHLHLLSQLEATTFEIGRLPGISPDVVQHLRMAIAGLAQEEPGKGCPHDVTREETDTCWAGPVEMVICTECGAVVSQKIIR